MFVVTKFLLPEEIGLTKVIYEAAALISGLAQLGTSASAMRFFPYFKNLQNINNGFFFLFTVDAILLVLLFLLLFFYS